MKKEISDYYLNNELPQLGIAHHLWGKILEFKREYCESIETDSYKGKFLYFLYYLVENNLLFEKSSWSSYMNTIERYDFIISLCLRGIDYYDEMKRDYEQRNFEYLSEDERVKLRYILSHKDYYGFLVFGPKPPNFKQLVLQTLISNLIDSNLDYYMEVIKKCLNQLKYNEDSNLRHLNDIKADSEKYKDIIKLYIKTEEDYLDFKYLNNVEEELIVYEEIVDSGTTNGKNYNNSKVYKIRATSKYYYEQSLVFLKMKSFLLKYDIIDKYQLFVDFIDFYLNRCFKEIGLKDKLIYQIKVMNDYLDNNYIIPKKDWDDKVKYINELDCNREKILENSKKIFSDLNINDILVDLSKIDENSYKSFISSVYMYIVFKTNESNFNNYNMPCSAICVAVEGVVKKIFYNGLRESNEFKNYLIENVDRGKREISLVKLGCNKNNGDLLDEESTSFTLGVLPKIVSNCPDCIGVIKNIFNLAPEFELDKLLQDIEELKNKYRDKCAHPGEWFDLKSAKACFKTILKPSSEILVKLIYIYKKWKNID